MRVYSYIVTHDSGFAPNPFHGHLTLACCKPNIRQTAQVGDWVIGLSPHGERVVYAMRVANRLSFEQYWSAPEFSPKKPDTMSTAASIQRGDNIYEPLGAGDFRQLPSRHSYKDGSENIEQKKRDLGGFHMLVAGEFEYFGGAGPDLPRALAFLKIGRGHRCRFTREQVETFTHWVAGQPRGIRGRPTDWPTGDESWRARV